MGGYAKRECYLYDWVCTKAVKENDWPECLTESLLCAWLVSKWSE